MELTLFMSKTNAGAKDVSLHRVTSDWGAAGSDAPSGEGGGTSAQSGDATWDTELPFRRRTGPRRAATSCRRRAKR